jgi:hypothetical protein
MSFKRCRGRRATSRLTAVLALATAAFCLLAASAFAAKVEIVTQGEIPANPPKKVTYFHGIQEAVNASTHGAWILIEPGVYDEEVKITKEHSDIYIRGMNRNTVIVDGQNEVVSGGRNGIEVIAANKVWIENLTVRNFERESLNGPGGNEIWWNGGADSGHIHARGWYGSYLTAYATGMDGGYGIFTNNETEGEWSNIYASGFNDSGMYLGACAECKARITKATMEDNALGYSGSNSGGNLVIEDSVMRNNSAGIAPNSENPGDGPPPQNGACNPVPPYRGKHDKLPSFESTEIEHCTIIRNNLLEDNNNLSTPANTSAAASPWGAGVELPGDYGDLVEGNTFVNNATDAVMAFEYPNPFPPEADTIFFAVSGNKIANNKFVGNGTAAVAYPGDLFMAGGVFTESTNNCASGNVFTAATYPADVEGTWGCENKTTPNPDELGFAGVEYLLELQEASQNRTPVAQAAPPAQETMPNPCEGVPANPLCPLPAARKAATKK